MWGGVGVVGSTRQEHRSLVGWASLRLWLGVLVTLASLVLALRGVDAQQMGAVFGGIDAMPIALSLLAVAATTLAKAVRWRLLFYPPVVRPRLGKALSILIIGQMINNVLPLRFGEVGRIYLATSIEGIRASSTFSSLVLEKLIDSLMLLLCLVAILPLMPFPDWLSEQAARASLMIGVIIVLIAGLAWRRRALVSLARRLVAVLPPKAQGRVSPHLAAALDGLDIVSDLRVSAQICAWSVLIWVLAALTNYLAFLGLGMRLPFVAAVFLLVVLNLGVAVPSVPGRLGVFQYLAVVGLSVFAVEQTLALSYSLALHAVVFLPTSLVGIALLWHENLSLRWLRGSHHQPSPEGGSV